MGLRVKILVVLGVLLIAVLGAESVIIVRAVSSRVRVAQEGAVREVAARLALVLETAAARGVPPDREMSAHLMREELARLRRERRRAGAEGNSAPRDDVDRAFLIDEEKSPGEEGRRLAEVGAWPGEGEDFVWEKTAAWIGGEPGAGRRLTVAVARRAVSFGEILAATYRSLLVATLLTLLLGVVLFAFLNRAYLRPVMEIHRATRAVSDGRLDVELRVETGDEIEELAESFGHMLDRIAEMEEAALDANPLTGLPGNATIRRRLESILARGEARAVVYADLDYFKAYNDAYGFEAGDRVIRFAANILTDVAREREDKGFVGHIGGDDYLLILEPDRVGEVAGEIIARFDAGIGEFYTAADRKRGYVVTKDRQRQERRFPLLCLSMVGVNTGQRRFTHVSELAAAAAELKSVAKAEAGSVFLMDRRRT